MFRLFGRPMLTAPQLVLLVWCLLYSGYVSWGLTFFWGYSLLGILVATHLGVEFVRIVGRYCPKVPGIWFMLVGVGLIFMGIVYNLVVHAAIYFWLTTGYGMAVMMVLLMSLGLLLAAADRQWAELRVMLRA